MIPLRDTTSARRTPAVTIFLIGMNVAVFLVAVPLLAGRDLTSVFATPQRILHCRTAQVFNPQVSCGAWGVWRAIFNALFLHVGAVHIVGNMSMLWLFGKNVEDRLGRVRFFIFYLACGVGATFAYVWLNRATTAPGHLQPVVGASGAIAGAIGAYLLMFPASRITTLSVSFGGRRELRRMMNEGPAGATKSRLVSIAAVDIPAWILAGFYFVIQLAQNYLAVAKQTPGVKVAYASHIGGFLSGMVVLALLSPDQISPSIRSAMTRMLRPRRRDEEDTAAPSAERARSGSVTSGWRALELFTDRSESVRRFAEALNDDSAPGAILYFHGDGGNGKSLLLRHLSERCTKRFEPGTWEEIRRFRGDRFAEAVAERGGETVPSASLDFGAAPRGDERPQEAFAALLMLRRTLAAPERAFPMFDFACVHYLHATGGSSPERLKLLFPSEERNFIASVADVVSEQHWVAEAALEMITRRLGTSLDAYAKRRKLDASSIEAIERMDPRTELIDELPALFARDLNASMGLPGAPARLVLFFDGHEAFWGPSRAMSEHLYFERDEWLRRLLREIDPTSGIVAVVAGREPPRWHRASTARIDTKRVELQPLGMLPLADADEFLRRAGVSDPAMRERLALYARIGTDVVHPLYLGMCADLVVSAKAAGADPDLEGLAGRTALADKGDELASRLLRYVDDEVGFAVRALAAARSFDKSIYFALGEALNFKATEPSFDTLLGFSFVWRTDAEGTYRIHDLLRRLVRDRGDDVVARADAMLESYHRARASGGDIAATTEAVYHAAKVDPVRAGAAWLAAFTNGLALNRLDLCRALLGVRGEIGAAAPQVQARMARAAGDFFGRLARHEQAAAEYETAIAEYDESLTASPADAESLRGKGDALRRLGELRARLARHDDALASYRSAIGAYGEALGHAPSDLRISRSRSSVHRALGDLLVRLARDGEALAAYKDAAASLDALLRASPDDVRSLNHHGVTLRSLGELHAGAGRDKEARAAYRKSIAALDQALRLAPDDVEALNNKGMTLRSMGDADAAASKHAAARKNYGAAVETYDRALKISPDYVYALNNRGTALRSLGVSQAALSKHEEALESYAASAAAHDEALLLAPDYVFAHNNKGTVLSLRAASLAALARRDDAVAALAEAVTEYDEALRIAPDYVNAHTNKAVALAARAAMDKEARRTEEARSSYEAALVALDRARAIAPGHAGMASYKTEWERALKALRRTPRAKP
jgi:membrane associated rhomboid family serine protease/tetratricopeptide (TPR) repeat protein